MLGVAAHPNPHPHPHPHPDQAAKQGTLGVASLSSEIDRLVSQATSEPATQQLLESTKPIVSASKVETDRALSVEP